MARPERAISAADVVAREQMRETVVRAVLALDEPFREAVLLRYYEGLAPKVIAARLGVPAATVRSRVARGLERLRARLDAAHEEGRRGWLRALAPWLRPGPGSAIARVLVMKKLALPLAALVLAALSSFVLLHGGPLAAPEAAAPTERVAVAAGAPEREPALPREEIDPTAPAAPGAGASPLPVFPAQRGRGGLRGVVIDDLDRPQAGVLVTAEPHLGWLPPMMLIADDRTTTRGTRSAEDGSFALEGLEEGPTLLQAVHADGRRAREVAVVAEGGAAASLRLRLAEADAGDVHVTVIDAQTRAPVAGADVELFGWSARDLRPATVARGAVEPLLRARTAANGTAMLRDLRYATGVVHARAGERIGWCEMIQASGADQLVVEVGAAGALHGELRGLPTSELEGATVSLLALWTTNAYHVAGGRRIDVRAHDGAFDAEGLAAGKYGLTLNAPGGARLVLPRKDDLPNSVAMYTVRIERGERTAIALEVMRGGSIVGRVVCAGRPVAGARVRSVIAPRTSNYPAGFVMHGAQVWRLDGPHENAPHNPASHATAETDAGGRYVLRGLQPGRHRLEVTADGFSLDRRLDVEVRDGATSEQEHELVAAGVLQVAFLGGTYVGVAPHGAAEATAIAVTRDGTVTFPGLAAGRYVVARYHSDARGPPVPLGEAEVVAGRTTWVDLRAASVGAVISGRVVQEGVAVAGAAVLLSGAETVSDAQGTFRLELGHPVHFAQHGPRLKVQLGGLRYLGVPDLDGPTTSADVTVELGAHELAVEAADATGARVPVELRLVHETAAGATTVVREVRGVRAFVAPRVRGADGAHVLGPFPPGVVRGVARFADGYAMPFEVDLASDPVLRLRRPPTAVLRLQVQHDGRPAAGACVLVSTLRDPAAPGARAELAPGTAAQEVWLPEDGRAAITVTPGPLRVYVQPRSGPSWSGELEIAAGEERPLTVEIR